MAASDATMLHQISLHRLPDCCTGCNATNRLPRRFRSSARCRACGAGRLAIDPLGPFGRLEHCWLPVCAPASTPRSSAPASATLPSPSPSTPTPPTSPNSTTTLRKRSAICSSPTTPRSPLANPRSTCPDPDCLREPSTAVPRRRRAAVRVRSVHLERHAPTPWPRRFPHCFWLLSRPASRAGRCGRGLAPAQTPGLPESRAGRDRGAA